MLLTVRSLIKRQRNKKIKAKIQSSNEIRKVRKGSARELSNHGDIFNHLILNYRRPHEGKSAAKMSTAIRKMQISLHLLVVTKPASRDNLTTTLRDPDHISLNKYDRDILYDRKLRTSARKTCKQSLMRSR